MVNLSPRSRILMGAALIVLVTLLVYWPALGGDFLLDDNKLITENPLVKANDGLYQFWFTTNAADYWPVTSTSFWLGWRLWGANPTGYHVTNLLLHVAAALLIWNLLRKLAIPGAFLAALLFAVHPVNVESVAWISQQKNTLALVFFLWSILLYLREEQRHRTPGNAAGLGVWYWLSLLAFVLALLSKGSVAILPIVLLLITWWQRGRIGASDVTRTAPFFLVAIVLVLVNVWFQTHGFSESIRAATFPQRIAGAGAVVWFYLSKALLPLNLIFVYPQWNVRWAAELWWLPLLAALMVTAVLWRHRNSRLGRPLLFTWVFFCVALAPVLGLVDVGFMHWSLVADHYQHIALIAVVTLFAAGISTINRSSRMAVRAAATFLLTATVLVLAVLTWQRSALFASAIDLYTTTLKLNPECSQLRDNLAVALNNAGKPQEAIETCRRALQSNPDSAEVHFNLAVALGKLGKTAESIREFQQAQALRPDRIAEVQSAIASILIAADRIDDAVEHCQAALRQRPDAAELHKTLATALLAQGKLDSAIEHAREALRLDPDNGEIQNNLAQALVAAGRSEEALQHYEAALRLQFDSPDVQYNLGNLLRAKGKLQEAVEHYEQALRLKPDFMAAESNWGSALVELGQTAEAIDHLQHVAMLLPESSDAHSNLGIALFSTHQIPEAIEQFQIALDLNPKNAAAHFNLGIALTRAIRFEEAADQFEQSLQLAPTNLNTYSRLLAAYEQLEQPDKAIATAQKGLALARSTGQADVAHELVQWLRTHGASSSSPPAATHK